MLPAATFCADQRELELSNPGVESRRKSRLVLTPISGTPNSSNYMFCILLRLQTFVFT